MGSKERTKTAQSGGSAGSERIRFLSFRNHHTPVCVALAVVVVALFCVGGYYVYDHFWGGEQTEEMEWQEELLVRLREVEIEWTDEMMADWESKATYPMDYTLPYALYEAPRFKEKVEIMEVGDETIFTDDFNHKLFALYYADFVSKEELSNDLLLEVANILIEDSVLLQEAEKEGMELGESYFGVSGKDLPEYKARNEAIEEAEELLTLDNVRYVRGEKVTIWFFNSYEPKMGVAQAREIAREKIEEIRPRLVSGELTFEDAGKVIADDPALKKIDPAVESNSYLAFGVIGDSEIFDDPEFQKSVLELSPGEVSEILTGRDSHGGGESSDGEWYDAYFSIVRLDVSEGGADNFDKWLEGKIDDYVISIS